MQHGLLLQSKLQVVADVASPGCFNIPPFWSRCRHFSAQNIEECRSQYVGTSRYSSRTEFSWVVEGNECAAMSRRQWVARRGELDTT